MAAGHDHNPSEAPSGTGDSRVCVRLHFQGQVSEHWRAGLADGLTRAGVHVDGLDVAQSTAIGVIGFARFTDDLCDVLANLSRGGHSRVLAVAQTGDAIDGVAWPLLDAGASDVFAWDRCRTPALDIAQRLRRWDDVDRLVSSPLVSENLVGESLSWRSVLRQLVDVAAFSDLAVLVTGESGTGKEMLARLIHSLDRRPDKGELVLVDCTTVVPTLSGSEFFGHEKGAFTGAITARDGAFGMADGGTLFLDEVGELPPTLQAELLRVVQDGTYKRVGSNKWRRARFRLVCATNRDLQAEEAAGRFRRDLYYRIAAWTCRLPCLEERREDILPLARHFLGELRPEGRGSGFDRPVEEFLIGRQYPGNVRELRQLVTQVARRHVGTGPVTVGDVPPFLRPRAPASTSWPDQQFGASIQRALAQGVRLKDIAAAARDTAIAITLRESAGNLQRAARALGVTDRALQLRRAAESSGQGSDRPPDVV
jgi:transcriptional regulator with GAF, ATPase, and Fis domain